MQLRNFSNLAIDKLNSLPLPNSVLVIPDGNGRWAKQMGVSISEGHKKGGANLANIIFNFLKLDISVLGIWMFSEDNWKRPKEEVDNLMKIVEQILEDNLPKMIENKIKFTVVGNFSKLQTQYPFLYDAFLNAQQKTSDFSGKTIAIFFDYGERFQLEEFAKAREKDADISTYELLSKINKGLPMFDMVLRTSGEMRMSGFGPLASLAEFVPVEKNLPELTGADFANALIEYSKRERRLGGRPQQKES